MAYNANIPQPTDRINNSQSQLLANFQALGAIAGNATAGSASLNGAAGFNFVNFPVQGSAPTIAATNVALYNSNFGGGTGTGLNELYVLNSAGASIPCTAKKYTSSVMPLLEGGFTYLPSGVLLKYGKIDANPSGSIVNVNLNSYGPPYSAIYNAQLTAVSAPNNNYYVSLLNTSTLNIFATSSASATGIYWLTIGI